MTSKKPDKYHCLFCGWSGKAIETVGLDYWWNEYDYDMEISCPKCWAERSEKHRVIQEDEFSISAFIENVKFELDVLITRVDDWEAYHPNVVMKIAMSVFITFCLIFLGYILFFYKG